MLSLPTASASTSIVPAEFRTCADFREEWPIGVARTVEAAKKQKVRPPVNQVIYDQNQQLDRNKNATVCEVRKRPKVSKTKNAVASSTTITDHPRMFSDVTSTTSISTSTTSTSISVPIVCPIANDTVINTVISSSSSKKLIKLPNNFYRVSRTVKGKIQNKSSLPVEINYLSLSTTFNGDQIDLVTVISTDLIIVAGGVYKWTVKYLQEVSPTASLGAGTYVFDVVTEDLLTFTEDMRCS